MQQRSEEDWRIIYLRRRVAAAVVILGLVLTVWVSVNHDSGPQHNETWLDDFYEARLYGFSEEGAELYAEQVQSVGSLNVVEFHRAHPELRSDEHWWDGLPAPVSKEYELHWRSFVPKWTKQEWKLDHGDDIHGPAPQGDPGRFLFSWKTGKKYDKLLLWRGRIAV